MEARVRSVRIPVPLSEIYVTDTVAPQHKDWPQLKVVSIAPLLAAAIQRLAARESMSDLFQ